MYVYLQCVNEFLVVCSFPLSHGKTRAHHNNTQILFSYFVVIKKMTLATYTLYNANSTDYDFGVLGVLTDSHNYLYIAALWLGSGLIYFLDMQIW